jgi:hypothetical protein
MPDTDAKSVTLLRLADGTLIDPLTRTPISMSAEEGGGVEESASPATVADTITPTVRRSLHDLKLSKHQMAIINNVLVYTLWGLPDDEIAIQCSCSISDVHSVRELSEYGLMHDSLVGGLRASYMASAQGIISNAAQHAATVVVNAAKKSSGRMQFDAARDILDRSGHRPVDHAALSLSINDGGDDLVIRVVRESEKPRIPTIDMSPRQNGT